jgi:hypothetical protein
MAEDNRNFLDKAQFITKAKTGRELTPSEMGREFARYGLEDRVNYLDELDRERQSGAPLSIREAAKRLVYERALKDTHEKLRKVDR